MINQGHHEIFIKKWSQQQNDYIDTYIVFLSNKNSIDTTMNQIPKPFSFKRNHKMISL